jgi:hypothetical protein
MSKDDIESMCKSFRTLLLDVLKKHLISGTVETVTRLKEE